MAGNPNVGKSTLFNLFTGMHQHTGNWPGKTVGSACGSAEFNGKKLFITDTPGTYSLIADSPDEENARNAILFGKADCIIAVCDACSLERSLYLALQIMEAKDNVLLCVNLIDEARGKGIDIDLSLLEKLLGCPVVGVSASRKENTHTLLQKATAPQKTAIKSHLSCDQRCALTPLSDYFAAYHPPLPAQWLALQTIAGDEKLLECLKAEYGLDPEDPELADLILQAREALARCGSPADRLIYDNSLATKENAAQICKKVIKETGRSGITYADRILTKPFFAWGSMIGLLFIILWLSIFASEKPGELLSRFLMHIGAGLGSAFVHAGLPDMVVSILIDGVYGTVAWVISVMLPPMAIFFPLFTLLEDWGFLPRIAFNMDAYLEKCGSCGKQALTMCMGLGCNTVGINGSRIIGSPREKLLAALTNSFMPCNGRFPLLISMAAFIFRGAGPYKNPASAATVMFAILIGIFSSLAASRFLSKTFLRGESSSFIMEIPPFRRPKILQVVIRSVWDRTLFMILRAIKAAAPAGALIWLLANTQIGDQTILAHFSASLEKIAIPFGMDGAILLAFMLAFPASEIALPLMLMSYLSTETLYSAEGTELNTILAANGWDWSTAACVMAFSVMHWPCFSALAAIKDECKKWRYVLLGAVMPCLFGLFFCFVIHLISMI